MISHWKLYYVSNSESNVKYKIEFEFKNRLYNSASGYFLNMLGKNIMHSFEKRIYKVYPDDMAHELSD